ncbi:MAG: hypothetical protein Ct9H300mP28_05460 [Pseudomonadota bacterium]|nr:MAG: hypothetical protein Ct9H300mP28_05460 [Pseudomonadota bacterium]
MQQVQKKGTFIRKKLDLLNDELSMFETIRGRGLMLGAVLSKAWKGKAPSIVNACKGKRCPCFNSRTGCFSFFTTSEYFR